MKLFLHFLYFLFLFFSSCLIAADVQVELVTDKLQRPWGMTQLPDGRFLVTERGGSLRIVNTDGSVSEPVAGVPEVAAVGQGGLLDVSLHPKFTEQPWVYLSFAAGDRSNGYSTEVIRARWQDDQLVDSEIIFKALPKTTSGHHFGSRLVFDNDGYLFISLGDRGDRYKAQELSSHTGSMIRIHDDGRVPNDNPFVNSSDALPEIFSYGHRNIQGLALNPETGEVWAHEHGPQGGDEVNVIRKGANYGWPVITYGAEYGTGIKIGEGTRKQGMEQPLHFWNPSIAPSGMAFYQGDVMVGALKYQLLARLKFSNNLLIQEQRFFKGEYGRIRDVKTFGDSLYLLTDANSGKLIRITGNFDG